MKHNLPKTCPVCGAKESGGGNAVIYYNCGGHMWIEKSEMCHSYFIKGHCGENYNKESEVSNDKSKE